jgi:hypothetical protein
MSKNYEKRFYADPHTVEIHSLANKTPSQTELEYKALLESIRDLGQLQPVVMYRGHLVDGRHRVKAAKELGIQIEYINLQSGLTLEEVEQMVVKGYENRRHQTPTQKAISAYKYYVDQNAKGVKTSMGKVSEDFGVTRSLVDRAKQVFNLASPEVFDKLWSGGKLTLGANKPTDSLLAVINYYKLISDDIVNNSTGVSDDLTDAELAFIKEMVDNLQENHNNLLLRKLADTIHSRIK